MNFFSKGRMEEHIAFMRERCIARQMVTLTGGMDGMSKFSDRLIIPIKPGLYYSSALFILNGIARVEGCEFMCTKKTNSQRILIHRTSEIYQQFLNANGVMYQFFYKGEMKDEIANYLKQISTPL